MNAEIASQPKIFSALKFLKNEIVNHLTLAENALSASESAFSETEFSAILKAVNGIRGAAKICGFEPIVSMTKELQKSFPAPSEFHKLYLPSLNFPLLHGGFFSN